MRYFFAIVLVVVFFACKNKDEYSRPENALDAGRQFIEYSLKGKFNQAKQYMLNDEENNYWLAKWSQEFSKINEQEKTAFSTASINILEISDVVADSVTIIHYSNSYKNVPQKIKVVKFNNDWVVDFKYTFSGNL
ncbi:hypothetical protein [Aridibaculum aurantiacum]|uniref:hypothetical protein n=1 Tax=Aridibaculum aurantiacum TaxID=2810307 RepID=UPI001A960FA6|nr:hypothetical protein [Aridibaculum aurantiacum]